MSDEKEKKPKKKKYRKAPRFFKRTITEERLEKKYIKFLQQNEDKDYLRSCYTAEGDKLKLRKDFTRKDRRFLKWIKKDIRKNRKWSVKVLPLALSGIVVGAIIVFFAIFANPLLQKAMETGLEAIFEARVNADHFRISVLNFEIGMNGLTIADRDSPMKNLIQFSKMRIKLKPEAVLRGKVYIEEIRADSIRFGTARTVSGALPDKPAKVEKPKEEISVPPLVDLQNFDPMALLNQEYDKLTTPKLYGEVMDAYETAAAKWKGEQEAAMARVAELQSRAEPLLKINVNDYKTLDLETVEKIRKTINDVNAMVSSVQAAQADVNRMVSGVQEDINKAIALEQNAKNALTTDFDHLRSYLDLGSGAAMEVLEPIVMGLLTDSAMTYIGYGQRALEILEKVKALQAKLPKSSPKPPEPKKVVFKGRDVIFPTRQYPKFFLGILATDVLTPAAWHWGFDLRGVSSDPDLSGTPTSLALSLAEAGDGLKRSGSFNGRADFRSNATERFNAAVSGGGFPVDVGIGKAGIGGFAGGASFNVNVAGNTSGSFSAGGDISLAQAKLLNPANTFAQAADEAIRQVGAVNLGILYEHVVSGKDHFTLTTNFTDIFKNALSRIVAQYRKQAEDALEKALREKFAQYVDSKYVGKDELDLIFKAVRGDKSAVDDLKGLLDKKKNELEDKVKQAGQQVIDDVKEQIQEAAQDLKQQGQEAAQQAAQDLMQGNVPSVPNINLPSAPSLPSLPSNPLKR